MNLEANEHCLSLRPVQLIQAPTNPYLLSLKFATHGSYGKLLKTGIKATKSNILRVKRFYSAPDSVFWLSRLQSQVKTFIFVVSK